jgi:hypothetical protein
LPFTAGVGRGDRDLVIKKRIFLGLPFAVSRSQSEAEKEKNEELDRRRKAQSLLRRSAKHGTKSREGSSRSNGGDDDSGGDGRHHD